MGDADAFAAFASMVFVAEGDDAMPVLKPDCARGFEACRVEAHEFVKKDATVRVDPAFWHGLPATPRPPVQYDYTTHTAATYAPAAALMDKSDT